MVVTDIENIMHQIPMTPSLQKALDFLRGRDLGQLPDGRMEIDGDRVFALIQRYETIRPYAPKFEYHRNYVDVQLIVTGEEVIGWAPAELMRVTEAYAADKDICFGTVEAGKWTPVHLQAGQVAVFWPEDGHAPKGAAGPPSRVMKIVVKVAV